MTKKIYLSYCLLTASTLLTISPTQGQVFTFDYLTYSDYAETANRNMYFKGKMTAYTFFGVNEFDSSGDATGDNISYNEYNIYTAFRIISNKRFQLSIAPQVRLLVADGFYCISYGNPWIWAKYALFNNQNIYFRIGLQLGRLGKSYWLEDNKIEVGVLARKIIAPLLLDGVLSYRLRQKSNHDLLDFQGLFNEAGNEIHYKLEGSFILNKTLSFALFAFGYYGNDKKLNGDVLPNSYSHKTSLGISLHINTRKARFFVLSLIYDTIGRYDKKGVSLVFNVTD